MTTISGLPAHVLLVHAVVVLLPLSALLLLVTAAWPAARRRLALANLILSVFVLVLVPLTTDAGEWLERRVPRSTAVRDHAELGDTAKIAAFAVAVVAAVIWWRTRGNGWKFLMPESTAATVAVIVLATAVAGGACYDVYRIGESGAQASWEGKFSTAPQPGGFRGN
ncbi:DUF2231 domain-containing protein [Hamadaea tsunoensis]|uniref:DUF2231 domain-containing protein n=1 Tax=Hamadaea tsunoensis TaxID=53368 RepID=UPI000401AED0|nr:DUF2231 domain-containing protein [Hamadaea tsunoensis]